MARPLRLWLPKQLRARITVVELRPDVSPREYLAACRSEANQRDELLRQCGPQYQLRSRPLPDELHHDELHRELHRSRRRADNDRDRGTSLP